MSEDPTAQARRRSRLRWITLGEAIAIAALLLSGLGLWHEWNRREDKSIAVIDKRTAVPLVLRGRVADDGRSIEIAPVESSQALQSMTVAVRPGSAPIEVGGDGELDASDVEAALGKAAEDGKGVHRVRVRLDARYVEAGADRQSARDYVLTYKWEGGGLFGGRSLRLVSLSRS